jgi:hypothetical protein
MRRNPRSKAPHCGNRRGSGRTGTAPAIVIQSNAVPREARYLSPALLIRHLNRIVLTHTIRKERKGWDTQFAVFKGRITSGQERS